MPSNYKTILNTVQTDIQGLSLSGISSTSIVQLKVPTDREVDFPALPGVLIAPFGAKRISPTGGTNASDDIEYPIVIVTLQAGDADQDDNIDRSLQWHETIIGNFVHKRLSSPTSIYTCFVDPRDVFNAAAWFNNYDAGGMVLRFLSREVRS
ncbi:hypothetical protein [uncultured Mediterranean phage uvDeep-CGR2-KM19-C37]|nr:hypothetical protein [uncultured Mediterranean phage uvDeep-CGR2-KM19-C37]